MFKYNKAQVKRLSSLYLLLSQHICQQQEILFVHFYKRYTKVCSLTSTLLLLAQIIFIFYNIPLYLSTSYTVLLGTNVWGQTSFSHFVIVLVDLLMFYVKKKILIPITVSCSQEKSSIFCKELRKYKHKSLHSFYLYKCIHFKKAKPVQGLCFNFQDPLQVTPQRFLFVCFLFCIFYSSLQ